MAPDWVSLLFNNGREDRSVHNAAAREKGLQPETLTALISRTPANAVPRLAGIRLPRALPSSGRVSRGRRWGKVESPLWAQGNGPPASVAGADPIAFATAPFSHRRWKQTN